MSYPTHDSASDSLDDSVILMQKTGVIPSPKASAPEGWLDSNAAVSPEWTDYSAMVDTDAPEPSHQTNNIPGTPESTKINANPSEHQRSITPPPPDMVDDEPTNIVSDPKPDNDSTMSDRVPEEAPPSAVPEPLTLRGVSLDAMYDAPPHDRHTGEKTLDHTNVVANSGTTDETELLNCSLLQGNFEDVYDQIEPVESVLGPDKSCDDDSNDEDDSLHHHSAAQQHPPSGNPDPEKSPQNSLLDDDFPAPSHPDTQKDLSPIQEGSPDTELSPVTSPFQLSAAITHPGAKQAPQRVLLARVPKTEPEKTEPEKTEPEKTELEKTELENTSSTHAHVGEQDEPNLGVEAAPASPRVDQEEVHTPKEATVDTIRADSPPQQAKQEQRSQYMTSSIELDSLSMDDANPDADGTNPIADDGEQPANDTTEREAPKAHVEPEDAEDAMTDSHHSVETHDGSSQKHDNADPVQPTEVSAQEDDAAADTHTSLAMNDDIDQDNTTHTAAAAPLDTPPENPPRKENSQPPSPVAVKAHVSFSDEVVEVVVPAETKTTETKTPKEPSSEPAAADASAAKHTETHDKHANSSAATNSKATTSGAEHSPTPATIASHSSSPAATNSHSHAPAAIAPPAAAAPAPAPAPVSSSPPASASAHSPRTSPQSPHTTLHKASSAHSAPSQPPTPSHYHVHPQSASTQRPHDASQRQVSSPQRPYTSQRPYSSQRPHSGRDAGEHARYGTNSPVRPQSRTHTRSQSTTAMYSRQTSTASYSRPTDITAHIDPYSTGFLAMSLTSPMTAEPSQRSRQFDESGNLTSPRFEIPVLKKPAWEDISSKSDENSGTTPKSLTTGLGLGNRFAISYIAPPLPVRLHSQRVKEDRMREIREKEEREQKEREFYERHNLSQDSQLDGERSQRPMSSRQRPVAVIPISSRPSTAAYSTTNTGNGSTQPLPTAFADSGPLLPPLPRTALKSPPPDVMLHPGARTQAMLMAYGFCGKVLPKKQHPRAYGSEETENETEMNTESMSPSQKQPQSPDHPREQQRSRPTQAPKLAPLSDPFAPERTLRVHDVSVENWERRTLRRREMLLRGALMSDGNERKRERQHEESSDHGDSSQDHADSSFSKSSTSHNAHPHPGVKRVLSYGFGYSDGRVRGTGNHGIDAYGEERRKEMEKRHSKDAKESKNEGMSDASGEAGGNNAQGDVKSDSPKKWRGKKAFDYEAYINRTSEGKDRREERAKLAAEEKKKKEQEEKERKEQLYRKLEKREAKLKEEREKQKAEKEEQRKKEAEEKLAEERKVKEKRARIVREKEERLRKEREEEERKKQEAKAKKQREEDEKLRLWEEEERKKEEEQRAREEEERRVQEEEEKRQEEERLRLEEEEKKRQEELERMRLEEQARLEEEAKLLKAKEEEERKLKEQEESQELTPMSPIPPPGSRNAMPLPRLRSLKVSQKSSANTSTVVSPVPDGADVDDSATGSGDAALAQSESQTEVVMEEMADSSQKQEVVEADEGDGAGTAKDESLSAAEALASDAAVTESLASGLEVAVSVHGLLASDVVACCIVPGSSEENEMEDVVVPSMVVPSKSLSVTCVAAQMFVVISTVPLCPHEDDEGDDDTPREPRVISSTEIPVSTVATSFAETFEDHFTREIGNIPVDIPENHNPNAPLESLLPSLSASITSLSLLASKFVKTAVFPENIAPATTITAITSTTGPATGATTGTMTGVVMDESRTSTLSSHLDQRLTIDLSGCSAMYISLLSVPSTASAAIRKLSHVHTLTTNDITEFIRAAGVRVIADLFVKTTQVFGARGLALKRIRRENDAYDRKKKLVKTVVAQVAGNNVIEDGIEGEAAVEAPTEEDEKYEAYQRYMEQRDEEMQDERQDKDTHDQDKDVHDQSHAHAENLEDNPVPESGASNDVDKATTEDSNTLGEVATAEATADASNLEVEANVDGVQVINNDDDNVDNGAVAASDAEEDDDDDDDDFIILYFSPQRRVVIQKEHSNATISPDEVSQSVPSEDSENTVANSEAPVNVGADATAEPHAADTVEGPSHEAIEVPSHEGAATTPVDGTADAADHAPAVDASAPEETVPVDDETVSADDAPVAEEAPEAVEIDTISVVSDDAYTATSAAEDAAEWWLVRGCVFVHEDVFNTDPVPSTAGAAASGSVDAEEGDSAEMIEVDYISEDSAEEDQLDLADMAQLNYSLPSPDITATTSSPMKTFLSTTMSSPFLTQSSTLSTQMLNNTTDIGSLVSALNTILSSASGASRPASAKLDFNNSAQFDSRPPSARAHQTDASGTASRPHSAIRSRPASAMSPALSQAPLPTINSPYSPRLASTLSLNNLSRPSSAFSHAGLFSPGAAPVMSVSVDGTYLFGIKLAADSVDAVVDEVVKTQDLTKSLVAARRAKDAQDAGVSSSPVITSFEQYLSSLSPLLFSSSALSVHMRIHTALLCSLWLISDDSNSDNHVDNLNNRPLQGIPSTATYLGQTELAPLLHRDAKIPCISPKQPRPRDGVSLAWVGDAVVNTSVHALSFAVPMALTAEALSLIEPEHDIFSSMHASAADHAEHSFDMNASAGASAANHVDSNTDVDEQAVLPPTDVKQSSTQSAHIQDQPHEAALDAHNSNVAAADDINHIPLSQPRVRVAVHVVYYALPIAYSGEDADGAPTKSEKKVAARLFTSMGDLTTKQLQSQPQSRKNIVDNNPDHSQHIKSCSSIVSCADVPLSHFSRICDAADEAYMRGTLFSSHHHSDTSLTVSLDLPSLPAPSTSAAVSHSASSRTLATSASSRTLAASSSTASIAAPHAVNAHDAPVPTEITNAASTSAQFHSQATTPTTATAALSPRPPSAEKPAFVRPVSSLRRVVGAEDVSSSQTITAQADSSSTVANSESSGVAHDTIAHVSASHDDADAVAIHTASNNAPTGSDTIPPPASDAPVANAPLSDAPASEVTPIASPVPVPAPPSAPKPAYTRPVIRGAQSTAPATDSLTADSKREGSEGVEGGAQRLRSTSSTSALSPVSMSLSFSLIATEELVIRALLWRASAATQGMRDMQAEIRNPESRQTQDLPHSHSFVIPEGNEDAVSIDDTNISQISTHEPESGRAVVDSAIVARPASAPAQEDEIIMPVFASFSTPPGSAQAHRVSTSIADDTALMALVVEAPPVDVVRDDSLDRTGFHGNLSRPASHDDFVADTSDYVTPVDAVDAADGDAAYHSAPREDVYDEASAPASHDHHDLAVHHDANNLSNVAVDVAEIHPLMNPLMNTSLMVTPKVNSRLLFANPSANADDDDINAQLLLTNPLLSNPMLQNPMMTSSLLNSSLNQAIIQPSDAEEPTYSQMFAVDAISVGEDDRKGDDNVPWATSADSVVVSPTKRRVIEEPPL